MTAAYSLTRFQEHLKIDSLKSGVDFASKRFDTDLVMLKPSSD